MKIISVVRFHSDSKGWSRNCKEVVNCHQSTQGGVKAN